MNEVIVAPPGDAAGGLVAAWLSRRDIRPARALPQLFQNDRLFRGLQARNQDADMPAYFFDFGGSEDGWEGLELDDDAEAMRHTLIALSEALYLHQRGEPYSRKTVSCRVRNGDRKLVAAFSATAIPGQKYFELRQHFDL